MTSHLVTNAQKNAAKSNSMTLPVEAAPTPPGSSEN